MKLPKIAAARLFVILAFTASYLGVSGAVQGQTLVADFTAGQPNGAYLFASWTPKTFPELLEGNTQEGSVSVVGHLFHPPGAENGVGEELERGIGAWHSYRMNYPAASSGVVHSVQFVPAVQIVQTV